MKEDIPVDVFVDLSEESFLNEVYPRRKPVIIRNKDIGPCTTKWSHDYLASHLSDNEVKVHVSETTHMDFINKNFIYRSLPFNEFIQRASEITHSNYFLSETELYYLRSLGDNPRKDIADIHKQFPQISGDIKFPQFFEQQQFFSSVFRISSANTCLWTHYDIMDNMLIQVKGHKRAVLFHPEDALYLYMNGDKSEVLNIENPDLNKFPEFSKARRYSCIMKPGDILFIPALWFHNMTALEFGVAVNVFWKHLDEKFYDKKDPYGNKDLVPAAQAITLLEKGLKALKDIPSDYRQFYARRMIARINKELT